MVRCIPMSARVVAVCTLALVSSAGAAHAFGGMIAIGQGQAAGKGMVEVPFTADALLETSEQKMKTRIHYKPGKVRDDVVMGDQKVGYIQRFDLGRTWMLMPAQNMYMELSANQAPQQGSAAGVQQFRLVSREVLGREQINGEETTKYKVVYDTSDGRYGGFTWFTDDNIAVKSLMAKQGGGKDDRVRFEMTSLRRTDQADDLFELPKGAAKFDMSAMGMMGGMQSGGGMGTAGMGTAGAPGSAGAAGGATPAPEAQTKQDDPNVAERMGDAARKSAEDEAVEESRKAGREAVRKALGGLFK